MASKLVEITQKAEDPPRSMAEIITNFLMESEVTAKAGAEPYERSSKRTIHRNGYQDRRWDKRLGTLSLKVPKLRGGGNVPDSIEHQWRPPSRLYDERAGARA